MFTKVTQCFFLKNETPVHLHHKTEKQYDFKDIRCIYLTVARPRHKPKLEGTMHTKVGKNKKRNKT